jgi:hypothetical protein
MNSWRFDYSPDIATCLVVATCRQTVDGLLAPPSTAWQRMEFPAHAETAMQIQTQEHTSKKENLGTCFITPRQCKSMERGSRPLQRSISIWAAHFGGPF